MGDNVNPARDQVLLDAQGSEIGRVEVIYTSNEIDQRIEALAGEIKARTIPDLLVVAILKGSFVFAADLIRKLHTVGLSPEVDFMTLSSYGESTVSSGIVEVLKDIELDVAGRNVLIVDDVLDSGRTLHFAKNLLAGRGASRVFTCVLLEKDIPRDVAVTSDFVGFSCQDIFVVGYGMDVAHKYRELPFVGHIIKPSAT